jgi:hypothetical protein
MFAFIIMHRATLVNKNLEIIFEIKKKVSLKKIHTGMAIRYHTGIFFSIYRKEN